MAEGVVTDGTDAAEGVEEAVVDVVPAEAPEAPRSLRASTSKTRVPSPLFKNRTCAPMKRFMLVDGVRKKQ